MTEKQKRFCDEYIIDLNAARAYKAAYPKVKNDETARANASRLLTNANVKEYISEQLEKIKSVKVADATEVMEYLTSVMRGEKTEQVLHFVGEGVQTVIDIDVSAKERMKAAELLGKRYSLFNDSVKLDGNMGVTIVDDIG